MINHELVNLDHSSDIMPPKAVAEGTWTHAEMVAILVHLSEGSKTLSYHTITDITGERTASGYQHRFRTALRHAKLVVNDRSNGGKGCLSTLIDDDGSSEYANIVHQAQTDDTFVANTPSKTPSNSDAGADGKTPKSRKRGAAGGASKTDTPSKKAKKGVVDDREDSFKSEVKEPKDELPSSIFGEGLDVMVQSGSHNFDFDPELL